MDVIRNFIHVIGITPENELPRSPNSQLVQYSDIETIHIPEDKPAAKSIFQVMIQVEVTSSRIVNTPLAKTMIIDGVKKLKIIYTEKGESDNANFLTLNAPYNTFIEIPKEYNEIGGIDVSILDAYFSLLDSRHIYSYLLYLVHAPYGNKSTKKEIKRNDYDRDIKDSFELKEIKLNELPIPQAAMDEILISKNFSGYAPLENKVGQPNYVPVDIDAEYL